MFKGSTAKEEQMMIHKENSAISIAVAKNPRCVCIEGSL